MTQPTGNIRKLKYPLTHTEGFEVVTGNETIKNIDLSNWSTTDLDERVNIVLNLSLNEYLALANTIDVGRDIAYGENSIYIWWLWVRSLESMNICASVLACIENNIDVQNAIQATVGGDPYIEGNPEKWQRQAIEPVTGCNNDATWGYVKSLWNFMNQQNIDFLEYLDEATNTGEQISKMMSAIPLFGLLPFDELVDWLASLGEYNLDAYNSSITVAINEKIWCDLFCIAKDNNCSLTFEQIWDYFLEEFGGLNFPTLGATFAELALYMVTGSYLNDRIVYLWTLIQLGVAFIGGRFLGISTMNQLAVHAQIGDPDNDWQLLCSDCGWTYNSDWVISEENWTPTEATPPYDAPQALWTIGIGWTYQDVQKNASQAYRYCGITIPIADTLVTKITVTFDYTKGSYYLGSQAAFYFGYHITGGAYVSSTTSFATATNGTGKTEILVVNEQIDEITLLLRASGFGGSPPYPYDGDCKIVSVTVEGTGTNPF